MQEFKKIVLKQGKDDALKRFHPWVFSGAIQNIQEGISEGDIVNIYSSKGNYLGTGHFQQGSIAIKVFTFKEQSIDNAFWEWKIKNAYLLRERIGLTEMSSTNAYRLVFGEADGLPGLIIDFYNDTAVMQCRSVGMYNLRFIFTEILKTILKEKLKAVYDKSNEVLPENYKTTDGLLWGSPLENSIIENDNNFHIDLESGQKTGFFIDQRENRELLKKYSYNRTVLNTYSYTGGFSVYALKGGATKVVSVDSSSKAIEMTKKNIQLNGFENTNHEEYCEDVKKFFKESEEHFDIIILDPPAFAKNNAHKHNALMAYKQLNIIALKKVNSGGFLFTFSCSQAIDRYSFNSILMSAALESGRDVKILHQLSQPADHPISLFHPEGEYLKGLVLQVVN